MNRLLYRWCLFICVVLIFVLLVSCNQVMHDAAYSVHVWEDTNTNGIEDAGEKPLPDVIIQFIDSGNGLLWQINSTDVNGNVTAFSPGGTCGGYQIYLSVPPGYRPTTPVLDHGKTCTASFGLKPYNP